MFPAASSIPHAGVRAGTQRVKRKKINFIIFISLRPSQTLREKLSQIKKRRFTIEGAANTEKGKKLNVEWRTPNDECRRQNTQPTNSQPLNQEPATYKLATRKP